MLGVSDNVDTPLDPRLAGHRDYLEKHARELKRATDDAIVKHKKQVIERQLVVERLAEMAIQLFATSAVLSRTLRARPARRGDQSAMCRSASPMPTAPIQVAVWSTRYLRTLIPARS